MPWIAGPRQCLVLLHAPSQAPLFSWGPPPQTPCCLRCTRALTEASSLCSRCQPAGSRRQRQKCGSRTCRRRSAVVCCVHWSKPGSSSPPLCRYDLASPSPWVVPWCLRLQLTNRSSLPQPLLTRHRRQPFHSSAATRTLQWMPALAVGRPSRLCCRWWSACAAWSRR